MAPRPPLNPHLRLKGGGYPSTSTIGLHIQPYSIPLVQGYTEWFRVRANPYGYWVCAWLRVCIALHTHSWHIDTPECRIAGGIRHAQRLWERFALYRYPSSIHHALRGLQGLLLPCIWVYESGMNRYRGLGGDSRTLPHLDSLVLPRHVLTRRAVIASHAASGITR